MTASAPPSSSLRRRHRPGGSFNALRAARQTIVDVAKAGFTEVILDKIKGGNPIEVRDDGPPALARYTSD